MIRFRLTAVLFAWLMHTALGAQDPCDPPLVASLAVSGPVCSGDAVTVSFLLPDDDDDNPGYDVTYSIGGNTFTVIGALNGHTEVHVVNASTTLTLLLVTDVDDDDDACFTTFNTSIPVTISSPALSLLAQSDPSCGQNNGSVSFSASGGIAPYQYSLNGGAFQSSGQYSGLPAGSYTVLLRDNIGCTDEQTVVLNESGAPVAGIGSQTDPSCGASNGSLTASASGGAPPYQYRLNGGAWQGNPTFSGFAAGNYTVEVRDANDCTDATSATLNESGAPLAGIGSQTNPDCGASNGSLTASASGGTPPYQYRLNGGAWQSNATFSGLAAGNYTIQVRDANNCSDTAPATLANPGANLPPASITANTLEGCAATVFVLNGNLPAGTSGEWSSTGVLPENPSDPEWILSGLAPGPTTISWTLSAPGCPDYAVANVVLQSILPPVAANDGVFEAHPDQNTETEVLVNDLVSLPVVLRLLKLPTQGTAQFDNQNVLVYQPAAAASGLDSVVYEVCYVECPELCDTAAVFFRNLENDNPCVITGDTSNVFTNGLTPNGDGRNDRLFFQVVSVEACEVNYGSSDIIIYNRWGDKVFEAAPYENDWEGKNQQGRDLPPGVYYFVLRVTLDKVYTQFGSVILIR